MAICPPDDPLPMLHGIALDPGALPDALAHCDAAGLRCKPPRAWRTADAEGTLQTNFTNAVLLDLSCDRCCVFFCE